MGPQAQSVFVYGFLGIAGLATLIYSPSILRGLQRALFSKSPASKKRLWSTWSAGLGVGALLAVPWAIEYAGPGVVLWATLGSLLGMGLAVVAPHIPRRKIQSQDDQVRRTLPPALAHPRGRWGQILRPTYCLTGLAALIILGALVVGNEGHAITSLFIPDLRVDDSWRAMPVLLATAVFCLLPPQTRTRWAEPTAAAALLAWFFLCLLALIYAGGQSITAFGRIIEDATAFPAGQSGLAKFFLLGSSALSAAMWATGVGLGWAEIDPPTSQSHPQPAPDQADSTDKSAPSAEDRPAAGNEERASVQLIALWLQGIIVFWCTALALLASQIPAQQRIDSPELRQAAKPSRPELIMMGRQAQAPLPDKSADGEQEPPDPATKAAAWLPLERRHARSFAPTDTGQSVVLPLDSPIKPGREYRALFRANPRGYRMGQLTPSGNGLFVPSPWQALHKVDTLRFRPRMDALSDSPAWDQSVAVRVIRLGSDLFPAGVIYVPKDPKIDLSKLSRSLDGPFVLLPDIEVMVEARLFQSNENEGDQHYSLIARQQHPVNRLQPPLRSLIAELGFRGPYLYGEANKHAPEVLVAEPNAAPAIGSQLRLRYASPKRGLAVGVIQVDGSLIAPPWDFLQRATHLCFRHNKDQHLDIRVPTRGRFIDGRLEFRSEDPNFADLRQLMHHPDYRGPYLLAPDYEFEVEVHRGDELPDPPGTKDNQRALERGPLAEHKTLVPLHEDAEAVGARDHIYRPHPTELGVTNAQGPFVDSSPARWLCAALASFDLGMGLMARLLLALLMLSTLGISMNRAMVLVEGFLGRGAWISVPLIWLSAVFWGTQVSWSSISPAIMGCIALVFGAYGIATLSAMLFARRK